MKQASPLAFFIAGTDTEIGKTLVSSAILHCLVKRGLKSIGMKPVASGAFFQQGSWCNHDVIALRGASNVQLPEKVINPYLFKHPVAPHIAAQLAGVPIELQTILDCYRQITAHAEAIVVEGVGGFRVPLNAQEDTADLAQRFNLPVILVVGMRLGCISHALLTAEAIVARGLTLAGWVANCAQGEMAHLAGNVLALSERISNSYGAPLLGCVPWLENPTAAAAAKHLDLTEILNKG